MDMAWREWTVVLCWALVALAFVGGVLQVLWIRARVEQLRAQQVQDSSNAGGLAEADVRGNMAVYSVVVDGRNTVRLNDVNRVVHSTVQALLPDRQFMVPHVCSGGVARQRQVVPKRRGVLVCKAGVGASSLVADVSAGRVMYLVANGQAMLVGYDTDVSDAVKAVTSITDSGSVVLVLYAMKDPAGTTSNSSDTCEVQMRPFLGTVNLSDAADGDGLDMKLLLNLVEADVPMQVAAYTTS